MPDSYSRYDIETMGVLPLGSNASVQCEGALKSSGSRRRKKNTLRICSLGGFTARILAFPTNGSTALLGL